MLKIPFIEFQMRVAVLSPKTRTQDIPAAAYVHVFNERWLREDFWPLWGEIKRELNAKIGVQPMQNNAQRGICDEVTKRFFSELTLSTRQTHGDNDVGPGALEATVNVTTATLNRVTGGWHRTALLALTADGQTWRPVFVEPQLKYAEYETTDLDVAVGCGVVLRECWL